MQLPILADDNGDLNVFISVQDAQNYLENIDTTNETYDFYDSHFRVLDAAINRLNAFKFAVSSREPGVKILTERILRCINPDGEDNPQARFEIQKEFQVHSETRALFLEIWETTKPVENNFFLRFRGLKRSN
jgi:hypothetical protein